MYRRHALHLGVSASEGVGPLHLGGAFPASASGGTLHSLGGDPRYITRNYLAFGGPRASVVGTPAYGAGFMTLSSAGYIQTLVEETLTGYHLLFARRPNAASAVGYYGNFAGGVNPSGVGFFSLAGSPVVHGSIWADGGGAVSRSLPASNAAAWGLYGIEMRASGGSVVHDLVAGASLVQSNTGNRGVRADGARMRIGSFVGSVYVGSCDVAAVATLPAALGSTWEAEALAWAREYAALWPGMSL